MKLFLFRHTQTVNTVDGIFRYNGHCDVDATIDGLKIFYFYKDILADQNIRAIYSSDLIRAIKGGKILSELLQIPLYTSYELREIKQGVWEGLSYDEIMDRYPDEAKMKFADYVNFRVEGAENLIDASVRVNSFIERLYKKHKGEAVTIVAHGGINTLIILKALNMELKDFFRIKQDFGCMNEIDYFDDFSKLLKLNYTPFYRQEYK